jgi:universal stress protein A
MAIRRVLVPVDFSGDSLKALAYAGDLATAPRVELVLLHVIEPVYYATPADMYATNANLAMLLDEQRRVAKQQLDRLAAALQKKGRRARTLLKTGAPAPVIVDTAKSAKADLIVMSTHGRTGLAHMLLGSVAEKVVRAAACPVLTVRGGGTAAASAGRRRRAARR